MDWTVVAIPAYFGTMGAEYLRLKRRAAEEGPSPADYERQDTITSLTMGVGSLLAPLVMPKLLEPITPGSGRYGKALLAGAAGAVAVTTIADRVGRLDSEPDPDDGTAGAGTAGAGTAGAGTTGDGTAGAGIAGAGTAGAGTAGADDDRCVDGNRERRRKAARWARRVARVGGVAAVVTGGIAVCTAWASRTSPDRLWERRLLPDLGTGPLALVAAVLGWDFIYYWNHRFMHESRFLWAIHVVHHSSEHYNLSTALRQPVADAFGTFLPYGALCLVGVRPELILQARGLNLLYQYWIHTDLIRSIGPFEKVLNTPSHHRVHHGSNPQYLDRNHGSILIAWDRLFGTFEPEEEPVVYGLTRNIHTFDPAKVATHEHRDMLGDVRRSRTWRERLSYVLRGPGWAYDHRPTTNATGRGGALATTRSRDQNASVG